MRARHRDLTAKYRTIRLSPEPLFLSRHLLTFFGKFTKKGKRAVAGRHLRAALIQYRLQFRATKMYILLLRILTRLRVQFSLPYRRKAKQMIAVPTPLRRNKRDTLSLHHLYRAIQKHRERALSERISTELVALTFNPRSASTFRQRSADLRKV